MQQGQQHHLFNGTPLRPNGFREDSRKRHACDDYSPTLRAAGPRRQKKFDVRKIANLSLIKEQSS